MPSTYSYSQSPVSKTHRDADKSSNTPNGVKFSTNKKRMYSNDSPTIFEELELSN